MQNDDNDRVAALLQQARIRQELEDWPNCLAAAREVLKHDAGNAEAELMCALAYFALQQPDRAADAIARVIPHMPEDGGLHLFHARCLLAQEKSAEAREPARRAAEILPDSAEAQYACGVALQRSGERSAAIPYMERTLELNPDKFSALNDLGDICIAQGRLQDALGYFRRSHSLSPYNTDAMSALCFYTAFDPNTDAAGFLALRRDLGRHLEALAEHPPRPAPATPRKDGRLRIGYLAYNMGNEVTSWFLEPVLARHDRKRFHITVYHGNRNKDEYTTRLQDYADTWRDIANENPEATADRIRNDGIDILVLTSFFNGKDHRVLAYRPAPIQVGYLNRVASTGLDSVDYIISEALSDPPGMAEKWYTESLVRLTDHAVYRPEPDAPATVPPPCLKNGYITFGSFNNHAKIGPAVIETWAAILKKLPGSRLIMRSSSYFDDPVTVEIFHRQFQMHGVDAAQLDFQGIRPSRRNHLEGISEADIALDPFPCNGGTTTCEALWMGLPMITMVTDSFMGLQGLRYLSKLGLGDLAASTTNGYIEAACRLADDRNRLIELRETLRERYASEMMEYDLHARELEAAYQYMWQCQANGLAPTPFDVQNRAIIAANGHT